ncbi:MAG: hypothetical protein H7Y30_07060 [Pyrinomonadaceae bacterium]|nr:hypothetical protein [Pyrinomonadaceae bacterium]
MTLSADTTPKSWLAFELGVLRRFEFKSIALPFAGEPDLGLYLKRWGVRVAANDLSRWAYTKSIAMIENNSERLDENDVEIILDEVYVPRHKLSNPSLRLWFNETDAWWFDNVRENAEKLGTPMKRALALTIGMTVGDYALSFNEETRELRQPFSRVFRRIWESLAAPVNNSQRNSSSNHEAREFLAEQHTEVMFLRLPRAKNQRARDRMSLSAWREDWVHAGDGYWDDMESVRAGRLGTHAETKQQYLRFVEDLLQTAAHLPRWAIAHVEDGFISTNELVEAVTRVRKAETIYSKDFSELVGARAAIITA